MAYRHGVYISEVPTSILPPVLAEAAMPVVFGTAPINMVKDLDAAVNRPILCYSYAEAVEAFGFVDANEDGFFDYTLCEFIKSHFALFAAAPVVLINVLDPSKHKGSIDSESVTLVKGRAALANKGAIPSTVVVEGKIEGADYDLTFAQDGSVIISAIDGGTIDSNETVSVSYDYLDPTLVTSDDVVGGIDPSTGKATGLELLNEVFPRTRKVPGQVLAPKFSTDPTVAAVMAAKAGNINGHFKAIALCDVPTDEVTRYSDVPAWKNDNNIVSEQQMLCWPMLQLGKEKYHMSTQLAGVICRTDAANMDVPYVSPSNKNAQATAAVLADGTEVMLGPDSAAYLNGEGIVTSLNFIGGWVIWGNRTAAYPGNSDAKDAFIAVRRMFNWIGNTLILTYWQGVDDPLNRRQIDTVVDSNNIWFNGLTGPGYILGGRVEFLETENPVTDLMDGISRFHVYVTPPSPNREIDFILEYDPSYLSGLFA